MTRANAAEESACSGLYPASSIYMDCSYVEANAATVQKLANAFVKSLGFINDHPGAEIAAKMPAEYAAGTGGLTSYAAAIESSKGMFNPTGVMDDLRTQLGVRYAF